MEDTVGTKVEASPIGEKTTTASISSHLDENEEDEEADEISQWLSRTGDLVNNITSASASIANIYLEQGKRV